MEDVTPRVNSALLPRFLGKKVRIDGRVIKLDQSQVILESADGGQILVKLNPGLEPIKDTFVEVIASVTEASSVKALHVSNLGSNIDLKVVNGLIELTMKHPMIFGQP